MTSAFSTFHVNECFGSHNGFNHFLNSHLILCEIFLACTFTVDHIFNHDFFFLGHLGSSEQYNLKNGILHILKYDSINILIQCSSRHYWATWTAATNKTIWKLECVTFFWKNKLYLPKKRGEIGNAAPFKVAGSFNQAWQIGVKNFFISDLNIYS